MAHESFEDNEVAEVLNAYFISVKVDREERPDIDEVYMSVCQAMTGSGGWPLTIIMTADKKPFFAGTYFPKKSAFGGMGLIELLEKINELWKKDRERLVKSSEEIAGILRERKRGGESGTDAEEIIKNAYRNIEASFDGTYGGFSRAPKFPTPHYLLFLLKYWKAYDKAAALDMVRKTLESMYRGGIFDHIGGGFSRYSTDRKWLIPHFEKMLYDNALLLLSYTECFAATGEDMIREAAEKTTGYVLRDLHSPEGAFFSAQDADSEGVEGKYYVWDYRELDGLLSLEEMRYAENRFGVTEEGNFEGKNILNLINSSQKDDALEGSVLKKLYDARENRVPPFKDTKISASWNALMIEALSRAGVVFGNKQYIENAEAAADFIIRKMYKNSALAGIYGKEESRGFLSDYANMGNALIALYQATLKTKYLKNASDIAMAMLRGFRDSGGKRFYMCKAGEEELFMRPRDEYDGAMPSGNSSAVMFLSNLYSLTGGEELREALDAAVQGFLPDAAASPTSAVHFISVLLSGLVPHRQAVISAARDNGEALNAYYKIISRYDPFTTAIYYDGSAEADGIFPELIQYKSDKPFAGYVCENFACKTPVYSPEELMRAFKTDRLI